MADSEVVLKNVTKYLKKEFLTARKQCIIVSKTDSNGVNYQETTLESCRYNNLIISLVPYLTIGNVTEEIQRRNGRVNDSFQKVRYYEMTNFF